MRNVHAAYCHPERTVNGTQERECLDYHAAQSTEVDRRSRNAQARFSGGEGEEVNRGMNRLPKALDALQSMNRMMITEITDERAEGSGYWIYLHPGWIAPSETHFIHEYTVRDVLDAFRNVQPCCCEECTQLLKKGMQMGKTITPADKGILAGRQENRLNAAYKNLSPKQRELMEALDGDGVIEAWIWRHFKPSSKRIVYNLIAKGVLQARETTNGEEIAVIKETK